MQNKLTKKITFNLNEFYDLNDTVKRNVIVRVDTTRYNAFNKFNRLMGSNSPRNALTKMKSVEKKYVMSIYESVFKVKTNYELFRSANNKVKPVYVKQSRVSELEAGDISNMLKAIDIGTSPIVGAWDNVKTYETFFKNKFNPIEIQAFEARLTGSGLYDEGSEQLIAWDNETGDRFGFFGKNEDQTMEQNMQRDKFYRDLHTYQQARRKIGFVKGMKDMKVFK